MPSTDSARVDPVELLARALAQLVDLAQGVDDGQLDAPTPCQEWTVGQLLDHLCSDLSHFQQAARGESPDWSAQTKSPAPAYARCLREQGEQLVRLWREHGDLSGMTELPGLGQVPASFPVDMQTAEMTCHCWDLHRATGAGRLDDALAEASLTWMRRALAPQFRTPQSGFGPQQQAPEGAGSYERLAAFSGREPDWRAPVAH